MKYFLDTKFIERPGSIQLISIGIASEDNRTFYAENTSFDERDANEWVKRNILSKLEWWFRYTGAPGQFASSIGLETKVFGVISLIRDELLKFFEGDTSPIFYGYFADYDWVNFCWIFGEMADLPSTFPKYCRDLKQMLDESGKREIPNPEGEHNALVDALWNLELYNHITK